MSLGLKLRAQKRAKSRIKFKTATLKWIKMRKFLKLKDRQVRLLIEILSPSTLEVGLGPLSLTPPQMVEVRLKKRLSNLLQPF